MISTKKTAFVKRKGVKETRWMIGNCKHLQKDLQILKSTGHNNQTAVLVDLWWTCSLGTPSTQQSWKQFSGVMLWTSIFSSSHWTSSSCKWWQVYEANMKCNAWEEVLGKTNWWFAKLSGTTSKTWAENSILDLVICLQILFILFWAQGGTQ